MVERVAPRRVHDLLPQDHGIVVEGADGKHLGGVLFGVELGRRLEAAQDVALGLDLLGDSGLERLLLLRQLLCRGLLGLVLLDGCQLFLLLGFGLCAYVVCCA